MTIFESGLRRLMFNNTTMIKEHTPHPGTSGQLPRDVPRFAPADMAQIYVLVGIALFLHIILAVFVLGLVHFTRRMRLRANEKMFARNSEAGKDPLLGARNSHHASTPPLRQAALEPWSIGYYDPPGDQQGEELDEFDDPNQPVLFYLNQMDN